jgi:hypothetical protein
LLSDLVELLDQVSMLEFKRPVRRCTIWTENKTVSSGNPLRLEVCKGIQCDCNDPEYNPKKEHFKERKLDRVPTERNMLEDQRSGPGNGNVLMRKALYGNMKRESPSSV